MKVEPRAESSREVQPVKAEDVRSVRAEDVPTVTVDDVRSVAPSSDPPADAVTLSGTIRLADDAVLAAAVSGDVRPEAVARARQLLESGQLGADPEALAGRIIDSLLESRDPLP